MKKRMVVGLVVLFCWLMSGQTVFAAQTDVYVEQQLDNSGAADLWQNISPDTKALFEKIGIRDLADLGDAALSPASFSALTDNFMQDYGRTPLSVTGLLLCVMVMCAYVGGLKESVGEQGINGVYHSMSVLTVCAVAVVPFVQCMRAVQAALSGAAVFMGSFAPVYLAVLTAGGQLRAAASYQTVVLLFAQALTFLANGVLLPLLLAAFALGMVAAVSDTGRLGKMGETLLKGVTSVTGIIATVFVTLLTVNGMLGAAADTLSSRMARLSLSSFVPVVGGALSEAFLTVYGCIGAVRTTLGAFGILGTALVLLPSMFQCVCWQVCLWVAAMAADVFALDALGRLLKVMRQVFKTAFALLAVCGLFMVVVTAIVTKGVSA